MTDIIALAKDVMEKANRPSDRNLLELANAAPWLAQAVIEMQAEITRLRALLDQTGLHYDEE
jgi:hypothetical protein